MKALVIAENFKKGISAAEKVIGKNLTLPILSNILLEADKGLIKAFATNLEIGVSCNMRAKVEKSGKIAIPARVLASFLGGVSDTEKITLEIKNQTLYLSYNSNKAVIKGMDPKDFPLIPKPQGDELLEIESGDLQNAIQKTMPCVALSESRQELTGVYMELAAEKVILAATDSFRLAEAVINLKKENLTSDYQKFIQKSNALIVPARTMQEVARNIAEGSAKVKIYIGESQIFFETDDMIYVSRIIDGKYPEYKQVVPKQFASHFVVKKEDMLRAVRTASIFSDSKSREVKIEIKKDENKMKVVAQSVETGENTSEIVAKIDAKESVSIAFNSRYLADALLSLGTEQCFVGFSDNFGPVALQEVSSEGKVNKNYLHIIMPIRS